MDEQKEARYFEKTLEIAREAMEKGHDPFGSILVDDRGEILMEQRNDVGSGDPTRHDTNTLISRAALAYPPEFLWTCTVYAAMEPCCMCTGSAFWANIGHIKYLMSEHHLGELTGGGGLDLPSTEVVAHGSKDIQIEGPYEPLLPEMEDLMREWIKSWG